MTWRFHSFMISFSPSLTSVNSSICCSESNLVKHLFHRVTGQQTVNIINWIITSADVFKGCSWAPLVPPYANQPLPSSLWASLGLSHPRCPPPSPEAAAASSCHCGSTGGCVRWCTSSAAPDRRLLIPGTQRDLPSSSLVWTESRQQRIKKYSPSGPQLIGTTSTINKGNENGTCR